jgi:hypothetical protein
MSPDWSVMHQLHGKGFLAKTEEPRGIWIEEYILPEDQQYVTTVIKEP